MRQRIEHTTRTANSTPLLAALAVACLSQPAAAQGGLEEVVVTAQRREATLQEVPVAVSAFDKVSIERRQSFNTVDIVNNVPNLVGNNNIGQSTATTVFLRGVGTTESIVTVDTATGFYVDDVYMARQGVNNMSLYDIERVEVLRGPQGTLHGRNTTAGAIKIFTTKPSDEFDFKAEASYGRFDRWNLKGTVNVPLTDQLFVRATAITDQGDGFTDNATLGEVNDRDTVGFRGALRWEATDSLTFDLVGDWSESDSDSLYGIDLLPANGVSPVYSFSNTDLFQSSSGLNQFNEGEASGVSLDINWDINDKVAIESITSYRNTRQKWDLDLSDKPFPTIFRLLTINDSDQFSQEVKLNATLFDDRVDLVVGAFYFDEESFSFIGDNFGFAGVMPSRTYDVNVESLAFFAEADWHITDKLTAVIGGRWTKDEKELDITGRFGFAVTFDPAAAGAVTFTNATLNGLGTPTDLEFEEFTPQLGLKYAFTDDLNAYFMYTEGFKSGGWSARTNNPAEITPFVPEFVTNYEAGLKGALFEQRTRLSLVGFYYDYKDLFNTGTGAGGNFLITTNDAEVYGIELEWTSRLTDRLDIFGFGAWQDAEYKNVDPNAAFLGAELQRLPEFSFQLGFNYVRNIMPNLDLQVTSTFSYQEDHWTNVQNTVPSGDIDKLDASINFVTTDGRYSVGVACRNCYDTEYLTQSLDFSGFGFVTVYPGEPATWLVTAKYNFK
ncbi:MAG: TonB-dependent receptor [Gammaproteobacteria bacterium]|nr:TonB-dependent receptor [Gammaproteobacteria bacterium]